MGEDPSRGREGDHRSRQIGRGLDRGQDRFGAQHHARSPAKGRVVHTAVHVGGGVAKVVQMKFEDPSLVGPSEHRGRDIVAERLGKERQDVDAQRHSKSPSGALISTRRLASTETTNVSGTRVPESSTMRSLAGLASTSTTTPLAWPTWSTTSAPNSWSIQMTSGSS